VRNGWNDLRWTAAAAVGAVISSSTAAAPAVQTAQGAQQLLATTAQQVVTHVQFLDAAGRANYVTGKYTGEIKTIKGGLRKQQETIEALPERVVDKQLTDVRASVLEAIDAYGRPSGCATRITEVTAPPYDESKTDVANDNRAFSYKVTHTNELWQYEPLSKFMEPAEVIDWGNAVVNRSPQGTVLVTTTGRSFPYVRLLYQAQDPDLADRIEYAMKFLVLSCGGSLDSGS
jgi:hypothetical protein